jgi:hypothetical protein
VETHKHISNTVDLAAPHTFPKINVETYALASACLPPYSQGGPKRERAGACETEIEGGTENARARNILQREGEGENKWLGHLGIWGAPLGRSLVELGVADEPIVEHLVHCHLCKKNRTQVTTSKQLAVGDVCEHCEVGFYVRIHFLHMFVINMHHMYMFCLHARSQT